MQVNYITDIIKSLTPKQKTYGLLLLITLLISIVTYNLLFLNDISQITIENVIKDNIANEVTSTRFYDLDNDGINEQLTFSKDGGNKSISFLVILKENGNYIGQFNFKHVNMRIEWIAYSDLKLW